MCDIGDIILIKSYQHKGHVLSKHSFVVLNVESDKIEGLDYDFVCNVLSSFKNELQRSKKLSYTMHGHKNQCPCGAVGCCKRETRNLNCGGFLFAVYPGNFEIRMRIVLLSKATSRMVS